MGDLLSTQPRLQYKWVNFIPMYILPFSCYHYYNNVHNIDDLLEQSCSITPPVRVCRTEKSNVHERERERGPYIEDIWL